MAAVSFHKLESSGEPLPAKSAAYAAADFIVPAMLAWLPIFAVKFSTVFPTPAFRKRRLMNNGLPS